MRQNVADRWTHISGSLGVKEGRGVAYRWRRLRVTASNVKFDIVFRSDVRGRGRLRAGKGRVEKVFVCKCKKPVAVT